MRTHFAAVFILDRCSELEPIACEVCYITVFKNLRFHLSTLAKERFQNDAFSNFPTLKPFSPKFSVFINVFGRFSVDDRRKRTKKYAFINENAFISVDGLSVQKVRVQAVPLN